MNSMKAQSVVLRCTGCGPHYFRLQTWCLGVAGFVLLLGPLVVLLSMQLQDEAWSLVLDRYSAGIWVSTPPDSAVVGDKCLSRKQHMQHRPASQAIPRSPKLESALRAYEKFHSECYVGRNWTEAFLNPSSIASSCRVLVYLEGPAGLGNRLLSLVSAFVYSLLTKRVLLMDSRGHLADLLCEPFSYSSWLLPKDFPYEQLKQAPSPGDALDNSTTVILKLDQDGSEKNRQFFCSEKREQLRDVPWLAWSGNQYFVPRFYTFPELWPELTTLFPNASLTFTYLSRYLFLPTNLIWEKILRVHGTYLSQTDNLIGIQIRRQLVPDMGAYSKDVQDRLLNCLLSHNILPKTSTTANPLSSRARRRKSAAGGVDSVLLVASLQVMYFEKLQNLFTDEATEDGSLLRVHMVSHERVEMHSYDQAQKAFVEMWLLSLSDRLITSSWSTFGYIAQGLGSLRPFVLNFKGPLLEGDNVPPPCYWDQSTEPCNHFPFYHNQRQCAKQTISPSHEEWISKYLQPCQDEPRGLQLVP